MMQIPFYVELATRKQDKTVIDLLRFPEHEDVRDGEWSARWWSHGKTKRMRSIDREKVIQRLASDGINELDIKWNSRATDSQEHSFRLVSAWILLSPTWGSALWAPVSKDPLPLRADERQRKNFGKGHLPDNSEYSLPEPSTLECFLTFEVDETLTGPQLPRQFVEWVRASLPAELEALNYFGYGGEQRCRRMSMVSGMGGVAPWTDQLGEKFDNIYPLLIGPVASCEGMAAAIGEACSLVQIAEHSSIAMVSIPAEKVDEIRLNPAVKDWVVSRDVSCLKAPAATLDAIYEQDKSLPFLAPFVKR
jgi:hypothetical protein